MVEKKSIDWKTIKADLLRDPKTAKAYGELAVEYELVRQVIAARHAQGLTQAQLAKRIGTRQSNISRFERGDYNSSLALLKRVTEGLGKKLTFAFQ
ncbi:MAG TPA: helix-turn-helix transcriptional regulator [Candidatus Hydrogenedentes bacterium]|nr:helix-turn-helix transcriptional regulator [Candidatus Hydrogenedentota bacterium]